MDRYGAFLDYADDDEVEAFIDYVLEKLPRQMIGASCDRFIFLNCNPTLMEQFIEFLLEDEEAFEEILPIFQKFNKCSEGV